MSQRRSLFSILWLVTVSLGTGSCLFIILINIWLMSEPSIVLPDITAFFYDRQSLNFRGQALFENHPSPSHVTARTPPEQQLVHMGAVRPAGVPSDPTMPAPQRWIPESKPQALESTVTSHKSGDVKVAVPKRTIKHKEGIKGGGNLRETEEAQRTVHLGRAASGNILAVHYYEQQTIGSRNLLQLQCLARHLNLAVVKPVMHNSFLKTPLDDKAQKSHLKFEDSFEVDEWSAYAEKASYAPLVEWEEFVTKAPRDVILVQFNHPSLSVIKSRKKIGLETQRVQKERFQTGCANNWPTSSELSFLEAKKFRIVRNVCFNFYHGDVLNLKEFDQHLLANHTSANVTIIFDVWRGLGSSQRVLIQGVCAGVYPVQEYIQPSQRLVRDAEKYIQTYLKGNPFVAIMGRLEMSILTVHSKEFTVSSCLRETTSELLALMKAKHLHETFISIDVGKYGTKKWRSKMDREMSNSLTGFFQSVYGGKMSLKDWESSFEKISSSRDAGYVALLQKVVVTRARCILFVGGGAFQRHALNLYRQLDANRNNECLSIVKYCTSSTKLTL